MRWQTQFFFCVHNDARALITNIGLNGWLNLLLLYGWRMCALCRLYLCSCCCSIFVFVFVFAFSLIGFSSYSDIDVNLCLYICDGYSHTLYKYTCFYHSISPLSLSLSVVLSQSTYFCSNTFLLYCNIWLCRANQVEINVVSKWFFSSAEHSIFNWKNWQIFAILKLCDSRLVFGCCYIRAF